jgi:hypothetical protein
MEVVCIGRWLLSAGALAAALHVTGCGDKVVRAGRPDVDIGPVAPLTFVFHNGTEKPLYVSWDSMRAPIQVMRDANVLRIDPGCSPACEPSCTCKACPEPKMDVMRVDPGSDLKVTWEATRYELHSCGADAACSCAEPWPATAGHYKVSLTASEGVLGGAPDAVDPHLLHNAEVDPSAATCTAGVGFELLGGAEITAPFQCGN